MLLHSLQTDSGRGWVPIQVVNLVLSTVVKRPGSKSLDLPPCRDEVKNYVTICPLPLHHGVLLN
jgi:hypothetical protein